MFGRFVSAQTVVNDDDLRQRKISDERDEDCRPSLSNAMTANRPLLGRAY
jgi:hypothetical protein